MTGRKFEEEVVGHCSWQWDGYTTRSKAMSRVKISQPLGWDPTDPEPDIANDLHAHVCIEMGLEDWSVVAFYTAVGSPLDRWYGTDFFFEFRGKVVTLDLTTNPKKTSYKADIIVHPHMTKQDGLKALGQEIARQLQGRLRQRRW